MPFKFPLSELYNEKGERATFQSPDAYELALKAGWFERDAHVAEMEHKAKREAIKAAFEPSPTMGKLPDGGGDQELIDSTDWIDNPEPVVDTAHKPSKHKKGKK